MSRGLPQNVFQGTPCKVDSGHPQDVLLRRPQDVRSIRPRDVRSGRPRDGQIRSLGDVSKRLKEDVLGTSWGLIFASWAEYISLFQKRGFKL